MRREGFEMTVKEQIHREVLFQEDKEGNKLKEPIEEITMDLDEIRILF